MGLGKMADLQARFAQLLGSIETKVEQIKVDPPAQEPAVQDPSKAEEKENEMPDLQDQGEFEMDPARLKTRQRQIDIGKNSSIYEKFISKYPRYSLLCDWFIFLPSSIRIDET